MKKSKYDRAHACTIFNALTGERRALEAALVAARHWLDVDLCHYSPDPLRHGGLIIHTAHHVTGRATPSHEWVEGFLDYYHLTGRREGLDAAHMVAENLLRHLERPHMREPGTAQAREGGWALRAMVATYQETGEKVRKSSRSTGRAIPGLARAVWRHVGPLHQPQYAPRALYDHHRPQLAGPLSADRGRCAS